jgi:phenylacetic acid degradation operon negative regulatory protein
MAFGTFHHPDISLPIIRRRVGEEMLEWLADVADVMCTRGRTIRWNNSMPRHRAYWRAVQRLQKAGFVARITREGQPFLRVTPEGRARLGDLEHPEQHWNRKWNGVWYALMYDVPEKRWAYREALRGFLKRMRMGQLQRSVWITPWDIRAEFNDLALGAGVRDYAHLVEFRTTLGEGSDRMVEHAWDFSALTARQHWFCRTCEERLREIARSSPSAETLTALHREEREALRAVMFGDPLLPRKLWPSSYMGEDVYRLHRRLVREIATRL